MECPPYLFDQFAKMRGVSAEMAKRALIMQGYADAGTTIVKAAALVGIAEDSAKRVARRFMIDFSDYRPYARREAKGEPRPKPYSRDLSMPASGLPLFSSAA